MVPERSQTHQSTMKKGCHHINLITVLLFIVRFQMLLEMEFLRDPRQLAIFHPMGRVAIITIINLGNHLSSLHITTSHLSKSTSQPRKNWTWLITTSVGMYHQPELDITCLILQVALILRNPLLKMEEGSPVELKLWNRVWKICKRCSKSHRTSSTSRIQLSIRNHYRAPRRTQVSWRSSASKLSSSSRFPLII